MRRRIFISRGQNDFPEALAALRDILRGDAWLRRFFEPFLLEEVPTVARPRSLQ